jgi:hypothetical protein
LLDNQLTNQLNHDISLTQAVTGDYNFESNPVGPSVWVSLCGDTFKMDEEDDILQVKNSIKAKSFGH